MLQFFVSKRTSHLLSPALNSIVNPQWVTCPKKLTEAKKNEEKKISPLFFPTIQNKKDV